MSYKIAIASSDGIHIDETFGSAAFFHIYEVTDVEYVKSESREAGEVNDNSPDGSRENNCSSSGCGNGGCHAGGGGCGGNGESSPKVELVSDCRCVVCKKIGFNIRKQFERKAITVFDVACTVEEALDKITAYFSKVDTHQSLRGNSNIKNK